MSNIEGVTNIEEIFVKGTNKRLFKDLQRFLKVKIWARPVKNFILKKKFKKNS